MEQSTKVFYSLLFFISSFILSGCESNDLISEFELGELYNYQTIAQSIEYENYLLVKYNYDLESKIDSSEYANLSKDERIVRNKQQEIISNQLIEALDQLIQHYPDYSNLSKQEKDEMYLYAIRNNSHLSHLKNNKKFIIKTRSSGDPEKLGQIAASIPIDGFTSTGYQSYSDALDACYSIGVKNSHYLSFDRHATCGYSFNDDSGLLLDPTSSSWRSECTPPTPDWLMNMAPTSAFFFVYASSESNTNNIMNDSQKAFVNYIWSVSSIREVQIFCSRGQGGDFARVLSREEYGDSTF